MSLNLFWQWIMNLLTVQFGWLAVLAIARRSLLNVVEFAHDKNGIAFPGNPLRLGAENKVSSVSQSYNSPLLAEGLHVIRIDSFHTCIINCYKYKFQEQKQEPRWIPAICFLVIARAFSSIFPSNLFLMVIKKRVSYRLSHHFRSFPFDKRNYPL